MPEQKLEIVVSRHALDELPNDIVKIVLIESGAILDPKRKIYKYGTEAVLEIKDTKIKISPTEDTVYIGKNSFYIRSSGLVHLTMENGEIHSQSYVNINKFMEKYRQKKEKEHLKEKTRQWERYKEQKDRY